MNAAATLIATAENELGYEEGRNNYSKYGKWFDPRFSHELWCDMFVSWCAAQVGLSNVVGRFAWTPSHANWFRAKHQWGTSPRAGAIVFFQFPDGPDRISHVGIVKSVLADGGIVTIEGNVPDRVKRLVRRANIVGYGYPAYRGSTLPAPVGEVPAFPLPPGWWYGPASGGPHAVTGYDPPRAYRDGLQAWQRRMQVRGWRQIGKAEGLYNDRTADVCRQFQRQKGLEVDGEIGINTWRAAWTTPITPD